MRKLTIYYDVHGFIEAVTEIIDVSEGAVSSGLLDVSSQGATLKKLEYSIDDREIDLLDIHNGYRIDLRTSDEPRVVAIREPESRSND